MRQAGKSKCAVAKDTALLLRGVEGSIGQRPTVPGAVEISNNSAEVNSRGN